MKHGTVKCLRAGNIDPSIVAGLGPRGKRIVIYNTVAVLHSLDRKISPSHLSDVADVSIFYRDVDRDLLNTSFGLDAMLASWRDVFEEEGVGPDEIYRLDTANIHPLDNAVNVLSVFCSHSVVEVDWPIFYDPAQRPATTLSRSEVNYALYLCLQLCLRDAPDFRWEGLMVKLLTLAHKSWLGFKTQLRNLTAL